MNAYFPQMTLEQLNAAITAITTSMQEKAEIYRKCEEAGDIGSAKRVHAQYVNLLGAKLQLINADYRRVDG